MPYADPDQQRDYQRDWIAERREAWLLENGPCVSCGSAEDLEVDHIDPGRKVTHRVWSWAPERAAAELAKCQVLCLGCHRKKTYGEAVGAWGHGDERTYRAGCRCDACRAAMTSGRKARRAAAHARIAAWKAGRR